MALSVAEWRQRIDKGIEYREKFGRSNDWRRWWSYYRGDFDPRSHVLPINMIFAIGRALVPRLYFRNPRVVVTPLQPGRYLQAKVLERLDNLIIREIGVKQALKDAALDAFLYGTGIVKRGYDSEFGFSQKSGEYVGGALETSSGERGRERIEYNSNIRPGWPWVERIHPLTFVVPWGTSSLAKAPWCAHRVVRPLEDVKADPKYRKSVTKELRPTLTYAPTPFDSAPRESGAELYNKPQDGAFVVLWEIYDAKTQKIRVIAEGCDEFLREEDDVLSTLGFPFYPVVFNPDSDHFWGISDCVNLEPLQLELNEIRTQTRAHRRIALAKLLYKRGAIMEDQLRTLLSGNIEDVLAGVAVDGSLADSVTVLQPHIPPDLQTAGQEVRMDMREITGFSRNQMGEYESKTHRSAFEAAVVERAVSIRVDERRDVLADTLQDIVRGVNDSIFEWWLEERVAQIVGPDGARYWVRYTGDDLRGEYTYRIDPDTALPTTGEGRKQEAKELYALLRQEQGINREEVLRHLLLQYEGIDTEAVMMPPTQVPMNGGEMRLQALAQQMAQLVGAGQGATVRF